MVFDEDPASCRNLMRVRRSATGLRAYRPDQVEEETGSAPEPSERALTAAILTVALAFVALEVFILP